MTPSLESVVAQIKSALEAGPTSVFYIDQRLATACNPHNIRILLDALEEAQRDSKRYQWLRQGLKVRGNHPEHDSVWVVRYDAPKGAIPAMCGAGFGADLDAAIDKAMEQPK